MKTSKDPEDLQGYGELGEERRRIIHDFCNVGDTSDLYGSLSSEVPLMCASSKNCAPQPQSTITEFDYKGQEACIIAPVESEFVDPSLRVYPDEDERCQATRG